MKKIKNIRKKNLLIALFFPILILASGCFQVKKQAPVPAAGAYKSFDRGVTWQPKRNLVTPVGYKALTNINILLMRIDPQDNNAIYMGTESNGIYYSYNGGEYWEQPYQLNVGKINDIAIDPKDKCIIYVAFSNQLFKTDDCNRSWNQVFIDPRPKILVTGIAVNPLNSKIIYISTDFGEVIKSVNGGIPWTTIQRFNKTILKTLINPHNPLILYALVHQKGIYKSTDGGETWKSVSLDLKKYPNSLLSPQLFINPAQNDGLILISKFGILKTDDGGDSWKALNLITPPSGTDILSFSINPQNDKEMYYGTSSTVYATVNGGESWTVKKLPTNAQSSFIIQDPVNPSILYLGTKTIITK